MQTAFQFIDLCDSLQFFKRPFGVIQRLGDVAGVAPEADLTVRAARLLATHARASGLDPLGRLPGVAIAVEKRLPMQGGVGGGSSDAATTLVALNWLWGLGFGPHALARLGLQLGADVPVFVHGRAAWAEGVGEVLQPLVLPPAWYVVLTPMVAVSTARIFSHPELKRDSKRVTIQSFSAAGPNENDLEPVVCREHPEIARHLDWLRQFGRAMLTGSGACVFSGFESAGEARAVLGKLPGSMTGFVARGLDRHPLRDLAHGVCQA